jgi:ABC-type nickel/cobalt efflux system permease component RcnA
MPLLILLQQQDSGLRRFLADPTADPFTVATALGVAFFLGAAHALTPGHGKTIVAAYLVGSRGRVFDAVYLGAVVTFTHTASVFALGFATLYASKQFDPNLVSKWLALASGVLVAVIGIWLLVQRSRGDTEHDHDHDHHHGHPHSHSHAHLHSHSHAGVGKGSLLSLGVSGGLVPCPEALIVLIFAVSIQRIAFGLALLTAFSIGLAAVLIAIGIAMVYAGPAMRKATGDAPWLRHLPVASALVVTLLGFVMIAQSAKAW